MHAADLKRAPARLITETSVGQQVGRGCQTPPRLGRKALPVRRHVCADRCGRMTGFGQRAEQIQTLAVDLGQ